MATFYSLFISHTHIIYLDHIHPDPLHSLSLPTSSSKFMFSFFHKPLSPISAVPKHIDDPKPAQDQSNKLYSIDGCGVCETSPLAEDLWATDGCWDRDSQFSPRAWPVITFSMES